VKTGSRPDSENLTGFVDAHPCWRTRIASFDKGGAIFLISELAKNEKRPSAVPPACARSVEIGLPGWDAA